MASTVETPLRVRRWTRVEYERLIELGMFQPGERLELLDGLLVLREPQDSRHAATIRRALEALRGVLSPEWQLDSQLPIALDDDSEPEPDVAIVPRDPHAYRDGHPTRPVLVVEVSEGSYRVDQRFKTSLYARAGVRSAGSSISSTRPWRSIVTPNRRRTRPTADVIEVSRSSGRPRPSPR